MSNWIRIRAEDKNLGGPNQDSGYAYVYGENGLQYPRLVISLHNINNKLKIECNSKANLGFWWEQCEIPHKLIDELINLLEIYKLDKANRNG